MGNVTHVSDAAKQAPVDGVCALIDNARIFTAAVRECIFSGGSGFGAADTNGVAEWGSLPANTANVTGSVGTLDDVDARNSSNEVIFSGSFGTTDSEGWRVDNDFVSSGMSYSIEAWHYGYAGVGALSGGEDNEEAVALVINGLNAAVDGAADLFNSGETPKLIIRDGTTVLCSINIDGFDPASGSIAEGTNLPWSNNCVASGTADNVLFQADATTQFSGNAGTAAGNALVLSTTTLNAGQTVQITAAQIQQLNG